MTQFSYPCDLHCDNDLFIPTFFSLIVLWVGGFRGKSRIKEGDQVESCICSLLLRNFRTILKHPCFGLPATSSIWLRWSVVFKFSAACFAGSVPKARITVHALQMRGTVAASCVYILQSLRCCFKKLEF